VLVAGEPQPGFAAFFAKSRNAVALTTLVVDAAVLGVPVTRPAKVIRLTWAASAAVATFSGTYEVRRRVSGVPPYGLVGTTTALTYDDPTGTSGNYEYSLSRGSLPVAARGWGLGVEVRGFPAWGGGTLRVLRSVATWRW
jgi:hypothetical protein